MTHTIRINGKPYEYLFASLRVDKEAAGKAGDLKTECTWRLTCADATIVLKATYGALEDYTPPESLESEGYKEFRKKEAAEKEVATKKKWVEKGNPPYYPSLNYRMRVSVESFTAQLGCPHTAEEAVAVGRCVQGEAVLTKEEAAKVLRVSKRTLGRACEWQPNPLPVHYIGARPLFDREEILKWFLKNPAESSDLSVDREEPEPGD